MMGTCPSYYNDPTPMMQIKLCTETIALQPLLISAITFSLLFLLSYLLRVQTENYEMKTLGKLET